MHTMIHHIEHIEVKFGKLKVDYKDELRKTIKIIITDKNGYKMEIDLFMTDSGTMNINQE